MSRVNMYSNGISEVVSDELRERARDEFPADRLHKRDDRSGVVGGVKFRFRSGPDYQNHTKSHIVSPPVRPRSETHCRTALEWNGVPIAPTDQSWGLIRKYWTEWVTCGVLWELRIERWIPAVLNSFPHCPGEGGKKAKLLRCDRLSYPSTVGHALKSRECSP